MVKEIKHRWEFINEMIIRNGYKRYLEIGLDMGMCFRAISCDEKISVDPAEGNYAHANPTYKMTSDMFFDSVAPTLPKFDIIFIDGLHHSDQVDKDIKNSLNHINGSGLIVIHDCNPMTEEAQVVPRRSIVWNGDVWKSIVRYRDTGKWNTFVLDTDTGLGVIQVGYKKQYNIKLPENWESFEVLDENRKEFLGLREPII